jgi:predicted nucleic acid-binding protein
VTVVVDSSFVLALGRRDDPDHAAALTWIQDVDEDLVTSPLVVAEMDELVARDLGEAGTMALWHDLEAGVYTVRWWADALAETLSIARRGAGGQLGGLADASLIALAARLDTRRIATFDLQTFRSMTTPGGEAFMVLPADA